MDFRAIGSAELTQDPETIMKLYTPGSPIMLEVKVCSGLMTHCCLESVFSFCLIFVLFFHDDPPFMHFFGVDIFFSWRSSPPPLLALNAPLIHTGRDPVGLHLTCMTTSGSVCVFLLKTKTWGAILIEGRMEFDGQWRDL